jgi:hypothetical protein
MAAPNLHAQAVAVTMQLDTNTIAVGQSTVLHVYAQVLPVYRTNADRIFSWYVDVVNTNGSVASADYAAMQKMASDKDPQLSSTGTSQGANRRGIYDTFLNLAGAGVTNPVELMRFSVTGTTVGQTRFAVEHGSGVTNLSEDFIVAPLDGSDPWTGGDYTAGFANLTVLSAPTNNVVKQLAITYTRLAGGTNKATLTYSAVAGYDCYVEYRDQLVSGTGWQTFPGGPHNSGVYNDTNNVPRRFYRLRATPTGTVTLSPFRVDLVKTGTPGQVRVMYPVVAGYNYTIEFRASAASGTWQDLPGGPHNSGNVLVNSSGAPQFFRVRAVAGP